MDKFYMAMDKNFQTTGKVLPIDVDLFAVSAVTEQQLEDLQDVVHRLRRTPLTADTLPSTGHAVIRAFLAAPPARRARLLEMLDDRINYGLFLDHYTANMLMDAFLREGNRRDAAKIATHLMLQEDWQNPISRALALYSCYAYIQQPTPEPWQKPEPAEDDEETEYVRVDYLRNEWNDRHFDLTSAEDLLGKTLAWLGGSAAGAAGDSCQLLGWALYKQWGKLAECCERLLQSGAAVCPDTVERVSVLLADAGDACDASLAARLATLPRTDTSLEATLRDQLTAAVAAHERADQAALGQLYADWEQRREEALEAQRVAADRTRRIQALEEKRQYLRERERLLWFFDNEERLKAEGERQWDKPPPAKPAIVERILRKGRRTQEDYVPPEVRRAHNDS